MSDTEIIDSATETLDTMLGYLGFSATVHQDETSEEPSLQVECSDSALLIGKNGDRLDDLQYLVNRLLREKDKDAPRVRVDVGYYRQQRESEMNEKIRTVAQRVIDTGRSVKLNPLNSYHRRIVHQALKEFPELESHSPNDRARMKRITIRKKDGA